MISYRLSIIKTRILSIILSQAYVSSAVTASVIILVLLVVLQENPPGPIESVIVISWTVLCINSLRIFSNMVSKSIVEKRALEHEERISYLKELIYVAVELFPIIIVFALSKIGLLGIKAAYKVSIVIIISLLFYYGFTILKYRTENLILRILGGVGFVLIALTLVLMRMFIN